MKIHIERDFSYIEIDVLDEYLLDGDLTPEIKEHIQTIYTLLPGKEQEARAPGKSPVPKDKPTKLSAAPATPNQKRLLELNGYETTNMTRTEATKILTELGY